MNVTSTTHAGVEMTFVATSVVSGSVCDLELTLVAAGAARPASLPSRSSPACRPRFELLAGAQGTVGRLECGHASPHVGP
jgi:hypothetical protein